MMMVCFQLLLFDICYQSNALAVLVAFPSGKIITEGDKGYILVGYQGTLMQQSFMVTVESYQCSGSNVAICMYYCC